MQDSWKHNPPSIGLQAEQPVIRAQTINWV